MRQNERIISFPTNRCNLSVLVFVALLVSDLFVHAEEREVLLESGEAFNGWLNFEVSRSVDGVYELELSSVTCGENAHRYAWSAASWTMGDPNVQVALLLPRGYSGGVTEPVFRFREVLHGRGIPGGWHSGQKEVGRGTWTSVTVGEVLSSAVGGILGGALSVAGFVEEVGASSRRAAALEKYSGDEYRREVLPLPAPEVNFCAAQIVFGFTGPEPSEGFGVLIKADRRTLLGQYRSEYLLLDLSNERAGKRESEKVPTAPRIVDFGPRSINQSGRFDSYQTVILGLWIDAVNVESTTVIVLNGREFPADIQKPNRDGVSFVGLSSPYRSELPKGYCRPGANTLSLLNKSTGRRSSEVVFFIRSR